MNLKLPMIRLSVNITWLQPKAQCHTQKNLYTPKENPKSQVTLILYLQLLSFQIIMVIMVINRIRICDGNKTFSRYRTNKVAYTPRYLVPSYFFGSKLESYISRAKSKGEAFLCA